METHCHLMSTDDIYDIYVLFAITPHFYIFFISLCRSLICFCTRFCTKVACFTSDTGLQDESVECMKAET